MRQPLPSSWVGRAFLATLICALLTSAVGSSLPEASAVSTDLDQHELQPRDDERFLLRIMPLGASITWGYLSTDGNGYRNWIRQKLRSENWQVEMVGSLRHGTMLDKSNQQSHMECTIDPNLPLSLGTDDAIQNHDLSSIGERMDYLLTLLYDSVPETTIILSTLLPQKKVQSRVDKVNRQYRELVARRRAQKSRIVLADMSFLTTADLNDTTHPTDEGYKKMASVWWAAFEEARSENLIQKFNYTVSEKVESTLDNSTDDPHLPDYKAPGQPTNGAIAQLGPQLLWIAAFSLVRRIRCPIAPYLG
ncbi:hypothetical protein N7468_006766 [Penicillium chermesinum]|uniref:SGNH hydrolase-type esterase domain-containing protein n=1 Tax=Penicillium chermesinum TaxID=63820 RepID=A0A9W9NSU2_9EURO|nr:uncharacterized protein N7468_006766 [Penicillium chermesinum]KAJ5225541.1 hypothetical protein N7468_006766 [Penicillium chermesinum]